MKQMKITYRLTTSYGKQAFRDIVQFVPFRDFKNVSGIIFFIYFTYCSEINFNVFDYSNFRFSIYHS